MNKVKSILAINKIAFILIDIENIIIKLVTLLKSFCFSAMFWKYKIWKYDEKKTISLFYGQNKIFEILPCCLNNIENRSVHGNAASDRVYGFDWNQTSWSGFPRLFWNNSLNMQWSLFVICAQFRFDDQTNIHLL